MNKMTTEENIKKTTSVKTKYYVEDPCNRIVMMAYSPEHAAKLALKMILSRDKRIERQFVDILELFGGKALMLADTISINSLGFFSDLVGSP
jgi:hypothetical protein